MEKVKVMSCGTRTSNKKGFTFSKSTYPDYYLFLFFHTGFISHTKDGKKTGEAYSYILHSPHSRIYHTNTPGSKAGFTNDWLYLKGSYVDELVKRMNVPTDTIVPTYYTNTITDIIQHLQRELLSDYPHKDEYIKSLVTNLFIELARNNDGARDYGSHDKDVFNTIERIKTTMLENYKDKWTLASLSKLSGFSQSYFLSLYKKFYKKSPIDDLIDHRVLQARFMLESNMISISEIAVECGFNTPYYFSRMFRQRTGVSPTEYQASFDNSKLQKESR